MNAKINESANIISSALRVPKLEKMARGHSGTEFLCACGTYHNGGNELPRKVGLNAFPVSNNYQRLPHISFFGALLPHEGRILTMYQAPSLCFGRYSSRRLKDHALIGMHYPACGLSTDKSDREGSETAAVRKCREKLTIPPWTLDSAIRIITSHYRGRKDLNEAEIRGISASGFSLMLSGLLISYYPYTLE